MKWYEITMRCHGMRWNEMKWKRKTNTSCFNTGKRCVQPEISQPTTPPHPPTWARAAVNATPRHRCKAAQTHPSSRKIFVHVRWVRWWRHEGNHKNTSTCTMPHISIKLWDPDYVLWISYLLHADYSFIILTRINIWLCWHTRSRDASADYNNSTLPPTHSCSAPFCSHPNAPTRLRAFRIRGFKSRKYLKGLQTHLKCTVTVKKRTWTLKRVHGMPTYQWPVNNRPDR